MKYIKFLSFVSVLFAFCIQSSAQNINWAGLKKNQKHIISLNAGYNYGLVYGVGYSYQTKAKMPILLNFSYSCPSGEQFFDDFKTKIGGQVQLYSINNFKISASIYGVYRRYENPLIRLQNFGSEMTGVVGYYKPKWFIAAEVGFDKAIVTQFKHLDIFKNNVYANVSDGWYEPATGGNFNYGCQTSFSVKNTDIVLKIGKVLTQDFKTTPLIPYYLQLGLNFKLNNRN